MESQPQREAVLDIEVGSLFKPEVFKRKVPEQITDQPTENKSPEKGEQGQQETPADNQGQQPTPSGTKQNLELPGQQKGASNEKPTGKKRVGGLSKNLMGYANTKADLNQMGSAKGQQMQQQQVDAVKHEKKHEHVQKLVGTAEKSVFGKLIGQQVDTALLLNDSANIADQGEELDTQQIRLYVEKKEHRVSKPLPATDFSLLKVKMSKFTLAHRFNGSAASQKQIQLCIVTLREEADLLMKFLDLIDTEPKSEHTINVENSLKIGKNNLSALIEACDDFLSNIVAMQEEARGQQRNFALVANGIAMLDLNTSIDEQFDVVRLEKAQQVKKALQTLSIRAFEVLKRLGFENTNRQHVDLPTIRDSITAQKPSFENLPDQTLNKLAALVALSNTLRKFDREFGAVLTIQGINPNTFVDERHQEPTERPIQNNFDVSLIRKVSPEILRESLTALKGHIKTIDESHKTIENLHRNLTAKQNKLPPKEKVQLQRFIQAFTALDGKIREFRSHLETLNQSDASGRKLAEAEQRNLPEEEEKGESPQKKKLQPLAMQLAAIGFLNFSGGTLFL